MRSAAIAVVFACSAGLAVPARAATNCPLNTLTSNNLTTTSTDPTGTLVHGANCFFFGGSSSGNCSYDLPAGRLSASASVFTFECGASASVTAHDRYTLMGPDSSIGVTFGAQLHAFMSGFGSGNGQMSLNDGTANAASISSSTGSITIPLVNRAGHTFELYLAASVGVGGEFSGGYSVSGSLEFFGLPAGFSIVSCQGLVSDSPVPALRSSWGRVKAIYR
jgi:hypothetical protein